MMQLNTDETWFATHFCADGTARTVVLRDGDAPTEGDRAVMDAVRIADKLASGADPVAHFEAHASSFSPAFAALVLDAYEDEIRFRTVPGALPRPKSLPPTPGDKGGAQGPVVAVTEPGPGATGVSPARASIDDGAVEP